MSHVLPGKLLTTRVHLGVRCRIVRSRPDLALGNTMKDINEVLEQKELNLERVAREVAALQIAALLLADESELPPKIPAQSAGMASSQRGGTTGSIWP